MVTVAKLREVLELVREAAPGLREAGVRKFAHGEIAFDLADAEPKIPPELARAIAAARDEKLPPGDALHDPETYGLKSGVPGFDLSDIEREEREARERGER